MQQHRLARFYEHFIPWHYMWSEVLLALVLTLLVFISPAAASMRFQERSLYMNSTLPGATTSYTVSLRYMSPIPVGSVNLMFCIDPIPHHDCVTPPGLDVSNIVLSDQAGEAGFSVLSRSTNNIILTRAPSMITSNSPSSYTFDNVVNPTDISESFSIRLRSHESIDATGPQIDFGSIKGQISRAIMIETQVPPMLIFCLAQEVEDNCADTNDTYYTNMGVLESDSTLLRSYQGRQSKDQLEYCY